VGTNVAAGQVSGLSSRQGGESGTDAGREMSMRCVHEILRLKFECTRSDRASAVAVSVSLANGTFHCRRQPVPRIRPRRRGSQIVRAGRISPCP
jgi:hypothetical protein